jgi:hypothetical protein
VTTIDGTLNSVTPDDTRTFNVPNGTTTLRVAMNAVDDGTQDFDMYVRAGTPPTTSVADCIKEGSNQFAVCELTDPVPGAWHVLVHRYAGTGAFQLTITQFGTTCTAPGSGGAPCDDGNACTGPDACDAGSCVGAPLGNGAPCTDGNACTGPDTCQSGICATAALPNGTPCDDGDPCSRPDTCQAGACTSTAPALTCKTAPLGQALLSIENRSPDTRDRLLWTWRKGTATSLLDFGNPATVTPYALCVYDTVGGVPQRRLTKAIAPGPHWKRFKRGFRFRDQTLANGGIGSIVLTAGAAGRSSVQVRGKGQPLELPGLPFAKQPNVIVQLMNDTTCWSSTHTTAKTNNIARFKAKN